jgi:hypothetical protein
VLALTHAMLLTIVGGGPACFTPSAADIIACYCLALPLPEESRYALASALWHAADGRDMSWHRCHVRSTPCALLFWHAVPYVHMSCIVRNHSQPGAVSRVNSAASDAAAVMCRLFSEMLLARLVAKCQAASKGSQGTIGDAASGLFSMPARPGVAEQTAVRVEAKGPLEVTTLLTQRGVVVVGNTGERCP